MIEVLYQVGQLLKEYLRFPRVKMSMATTPYCLVVPKREIFVEHLSVLSELIVLRYAVIHNAYRIILFLNNSTMFKQNQVHYVVLTNHRQAYFRIK